MSLRKLIKYVYIAFGFLLIAGLVMLEQRQYLRVVHSTFLEVMVRTFSTIESSFQKVSSGIHSFFDLEYKYKDLISKTKKEAFFWQLEAERLRSELEIVRKVLDFKSDVHFKHIATQMVIVQGAFEQSHKAYITIGKKLEFPTGLARNL